MLKTTISTVFELSFPNCKFTGEVKLKKKSTKTFVKLIGKKMVPNRVEGLLWVLPGTEHV